MKQPPTHCTLICSGPSRRRHGIVKLTIIVVLVLIATLTAGYFFVRSTEQSNGVAAGALTYKIEKSEFVSSVNESGEIESSNNIEIRCEVKSQGKAGTAIIKLIDEGTIVAEGDFLCQLDDSVLRDQLTEQKIQVAEDRAAVIQATSDLDTAKRMLNEFNNGTFAQEQATLEANVALAEESFRRATEFRRYSLELNRKGYTTKTQLEADTFAAEKAKLDLKLARQALQVYVDLTKDRMLAEFDAEIKKQMANVEARNFTYDLSVARSAEIEEQIASSRIVAPSAGMVVYANEIDRRGDASFVIEEGALIRDGQPIFRLPNPEEMQVRTKVSDSKINRVDVGSKALIRVDTNPEQPVAGVVRRVSSFPLPRRWFQAPIEYEVFVDIVEQSELIRPGLRGKVEIFIERIDDSIQAPVSSLVRNNDDYFVFIRTANDGIEPRQVEIGSNNEKFVVIESGLQEGEEVLIDADNFIDDVEFPSAS